MSNHQKKTKKELLKGIEILENERDFLKRELLKEADSYKKCFKELCAANDRIKETQKLLDQRYEDIRQEWLNNHTTPTHPDNEVSRYATGDNAL